MFAVQRERNAAIMNQAFANVNRRNPLAYMTGATAGTMGAATYPNYMSPASSPSGGDGGDKPDHATVLDAVTTVGTLANNLVGIFGGGTQGAGNNAFNFWN